MEMFSVSVNSISLHGHETMPVPGENKFFTTYSWKWQSLLLDNSTTMYFYYSGTHFG